MFQTIVNLPESNTVIVAGVYRYTWRSTDVQQHQRVVNNNDRGQPAIGDNRRRRGVHKPSFATKYKIMGLDICADAMVGDAMRRGISGGQKKRLTTGEMIVGPTRALFMDEISNGLDSSTTFQIVTWLKQLCHFSEATILVSLLQPAPETYGLFDDIILMAEGKIVYHGPRTEILSFLEGCGFRCPERKGVADFLQEVLSKMDQEQYWISTNGRYNYVSVDELFRKFVEHGTGKSLEEELHIPFDCSQCHKGALSYSLYSLPAMQLLKACMRREFLLMRRSALVYIFKATQLTVMAFITMTTFIRTRMRTDLLHANHYLGSIFYSIMLIMFSGYPELAMTVSRLAVFYKQRDLHFYPAWAYAVSTSLLKVPISLIESLIWTSLTYYVIGYSPEAVRFFSQFLLLFLVHQTAFSAFRFLASYFQIPVLSSFAASTVSILSVLFGGFIIPKESMPAWLRWGFWTSPLTYAEIGLSGNEFLAPRWQKLNSSNTTIGKQVLIPRGLDYPRSFHWVAVVVLLGYILVFNLAFTLALTFKKPIGRSRTIISRNKIYVTRGEDRDGGEDLKQYSYSNRQSEPIELKEKERIVLPFVPLVMTFQDVRYYVEIPLVMKELGYTENRLQLLHDITGAFRPGVLTALMGISGAGKTTLLDVLTGRKTGGIIEGDICIGGYPKVQETFARISGYCEQNDIHSGQITVEESVVYSAWLRLPSQVDSKTRADFVQQVLETIELHGIKDVLVGSPGINGLSTEQRKRLTIAVELVSNPSIIFMDEPTSGLDARAAAIVIRAVKNVAATGRTTVCTIHQPSIDIFEAFDELLLLKRGGEMIYSGELGQYSSKIIEYFESIPGVPRIKDNYNPATWMMEVTSKATENYLGIDFACIYKDSSLYNENLEQVKKLSTPEPESEHLSFPTLFPQNSWEQFKACLWKQHLSYWRSPAYNLARIFYTTMTSMVFAGLLWKKGKSFDSQQHFFNMLGSMYIATLFIGVSNCSSVVPFVAVQRLVFYRERFAGMYSSWVYSLAQITIEVPYVFLQTVLIVVITYPTINYYWNAYKFLWFFYTIFCTLLYFVYFGMFLVSLTPNTQIATISTSLFYQMQNLFSGFLLPGPQIPTWWIWLHYMSPMAWTLRAFFTAQYGDVTKEIMVFGKSTRVVDFLRDYFGFHHDLLFLTGVVLFAFPTIFAALFGYCIANLSFQRR